MTWREDSGALVRDYGFRDFEEAMGFVNRVAEVAEDLDHHPDILVHGWNKVRLTLVTHDAGDIVTDRDRQLAARIDEIAS